MSEVADQMVTRTVSAPVSIDATARTVEVVFSAGTRAKNMLPGVGVVWEELDMSPNAVRMDTLRSGSAPVLDTHKHGEARSVLGRVVGARIANGRGYATLKISEADDVKPIWQRISDGTLRHVSVGYVAKYEAARSSDGETVYRATDWEPKEISFCAIPVDIHAGVRAMGELAPGHEILSDIPLPADASAQVRAAEAPAVRSAPGISNPQPQESRMADPVTTVPESPAAPAPIIDADAVRAAAVAVERTRISEIETVVTAARGALGGRADEIRTRAIADGQSVEQVRAALLDAVLAGQQPLNEAPRPTSQVQMGRSGDDPAVIRSAMADAIAIQMRPDFKPATDEFRSWVGARPTDMARALMQARGERDIPFNRVELAKRSMHSTSDFPLLLSSALNKVLLADYALAAPTYRMFMKRSVFNDFKPHSFLNVGDFPTLVPLAEGGTITLGTMSEGREQITLATYGRGFRYTRQMMVNDDLSAFSDFTSMIGRRVLDFESATAFSVLTTASGAGPNLADGNAVFTTTRGNRASSGGAIDVNTLSTARQALRGRTSPDGLKLNLAPRYLLTGPAYETIAWQYTSAQFVPATAGTANPFQGTYTPIVDANITGNNWYLFADPNAPNAAVYTYGFLAGAEGPQTRTYTPESSDGAVALDVWLDFACGAVNWRGAQFNPGA